MHEPIDGAVVIVVIRVKNVAVSLSFCSLLPRSYSSSSLLCDTSQFGCLMNIPGNINLLCVNSSGRLIGFWSFRFGRCCQLEPYPLRTQRETHREVVVPVSNRVHVVADRGFGGNCFVGPWVVGRRSNRLFSLWQCRSG